MRSREDSTSIDRAWRRNLLVCALGSFTTIVGMTLILPILPLHIRNLGVTGNSEVIAWSGVAYSATFLTAGLSAPLWGRLGDRYGRKSMLLRASLGMAIAMPLIGVAQDVWQLVLFRLLAGLLGGYASGSTILIAAQVPHKRMSWALGVLASAAMAGNVTGPLLGGVIAEAVSVRAAFLVTGVLIFLAFLGTAFFVTEPAPESPTEASAEPGSADSTEATTGQPQRRHSPTHPTSPHTSATGLPHSTALPHRGIILSLLGLSSLLMFAIVSVEPIITVHIEELTGSTNAADTMGTGASVAFSAALVFSLTAIGSMISAPVLGALADRVGALRVLIVSLLVATVLLGAQALAAELWVFAGLRFLTGLALGGITPAVVAILRRLVPANRIGQVLGFNVSAQYLGQVAGPILAGALGGIAGTSSVFLLTAVLTAIGAVIALKIRRSTAIQ